MADGWRIQGHCASRGGGARQKTTFGWRLFCGRAPRRGPWARFSAQPTDVLSMHSGPTHRIRPDVKIGGICTAGYQDSDIR